MFRVSGIMLQVILLLNICFYLSKYSNPNRYAPEVSGQDERNDPVENVRAILLSTPNLDLNFSTPQPLNPSTQKNFQLSAFSFLSSPQSFSFVEVGEEG